MIFESITELDKVLVEDLRWLWCMTRRQWQLLPRLWRLPWHRTSRCPPRAWLGRRATCASTPVQANVAARLAPVRKSRLLKAKRRVGRIARFCNGSCKGEAQMFVAGVGGHRHLATHLQQVGSQAARASGLGLLAWRCKACVIQRWKRSQAPGDSMRPHGGGRRPQPTCFLTSWSTHFARKRKRRTNKEKKRKQTKRKMRKTKEEKQ